MKLSSATITVSFVFLAAILWYATTQLTESTIIQLAVLLGVGVVGPLAVTEWSRER